MAAVGCGYRHLVVAAARRQDLGDGPGEHYTPGHNRRTPEELTAIEILFDHLLDRPIHLSHLLNYWQTRAGSVRYHLIAYVNGGRSLPGLTDCVNLESAQIAGVRIAMA